MPSMVSSHRARPGALGAVERGREGAPPLPLHLTARGRRLVVLLAAALGCLVGLYGGKAVADEPAPTSPVREVVAAGETLWSLASRVSAPGEDLRDVVAGIQRLNGMESAALRAGDVILLPAG